MLRQKSPNVLNVGDTVLYSVFGWKGDPRYIYPFEVRVVAFKGDRVITESVPRSEDPMIDNDWNCSFRSLRRTKPPEIPDKNVSISET